MTRTKKIEDIKGNQISQNEEGILVNEETGNSRIAARQALP